MNTEDRFPASPTAVDSENTLKASPPASIEPAETRFLKWALFGSEGLRAGWSVAIFLTLTRIVMEVLGFATAVLLSNVLHIKLSSLSPVSALIGEAIQFIAIFGAVTVCALIEGRRILGYNLTGPTRLRHFLIGSAVGFAALSVLVASLYAGGWLRLGPGGMSGIQIAQFGVLWGIAFLLTGFAEEGSMRCYLQFTLTRGINFWWACGLNGVMCLCGLLWVHNEGMWGVYAMAALGLVPCLMLYLKRSQSAGFWQAAWVTSTFFGFIHTGNNGETWIGIFAAAAIGFVFCVSIRLTGSAWWAIGFHASWDWGQTFFYGTADSGYVAQGHLFTATPAGAALWSGGPDGPEGSLLILPMTLLILLGIVLAYRRKRSNSATLPIPLQVTE